MSPACLQHAELWIYSGWRSARWGLIQKQTVQKKHQAGTLKGKLTSRLCTASVLNRTAPALGKSTGPSCKCKEGSSLLLEPQEGRGEYLSCSLSDGCWGQKGGEKGCFNGGSDCWTWGVSVTRTAFCSRVGVPFHRAGTASLISSPARHSLVLC